MGFLICLDLPVMASSNVMESVVEGKADFDKPIDREKVFIIFLLHLL